MDKAFAAQVWGPEFASPDPGKAGQGNTHPQSVILWQDGGHRQENPQILMAQLAWHTHGNETLSQERWHVKMTSNLHMCAWEG